MSLNFLAWPSVCLFICLSDCLIFRCVSLSDLIHVFFFVNCFYGQFVPVPGKSWLDDAMVHRLVGCSDCNVHMWSELGNIPTGVPNLNTFFLHSCATLVTIWYKYHELGYRHCVKFGIVYCCLDWWIDILAVSQFLSERIPCYL